MWQDCSKKICRTRDTIRMFPNWKGTTHPNSWTFYSRFFTSSLLIFSTGPNNKTSQELDNHYRTDNHLIALKLLCDLANSSHSLSLPIQNLSSVYLGVVYSLVVARLIYGKPTIMDVLSSFEIYVYKRSPYLEC